MGNAGDTAVALALLSKRTRTVRTRLVWSSTTLALNCWVEFES